MSVLAGKIFTRAATILAVMASSNSRPTTGGPAGAPIDWSAVWAEHGRWLRTVVIARLGVSESAIETRLHRARARLRAELIALNVIEVSQ